MLNTARELYDKLLKIYKTQYDKITKAHQKMIKVQCIPENIPTDIYLHEDKYDLPPMLALEGDEE